MLFQKNVRVIYFAILLLCAPCVYAGGYYISQSAQGTNDGLSCANAHAASWFNSASNWGTAAQKIAPGSQVNLCGTISTDLTFQGDGSSGSYVVLNGTGATYSGSINTSNHSWWKVQNISYASGSAGMITILGGANGVFQNNYADNVTGGVFIAQYNGSVLPQNISVSGNYIRTTTADLGSGGQVDILVTEGSNNITIEGNYLEMRAGGVGGGSQHDDCIQTWEKGGTSGGPPSNWTVRHNKIVMNSPSANDRSWMMLENLTGTNLIYGNVFVGLQGASSANGLVIDSSSSSALFNIYNNTFVAKGTASNNILNLSAPGTVNLKNNVIHAQGQTALTGSMTVNRDHNLWFGSNIPSCTGKSGEICGKDPLFTSYANNDFSLQSSSPALNVGVNLGSAVNTFVLATSTWPGPALGTRATAGAWSMSAYDLSSISTTPTGGLTAPKNLRVLP